VVAGSLNGESRPGRTEIGKNTRVERNGHHEFKKIRCGCNHCARSSSGLSHCSRAPGKSQHGIRSGTSSAGPSGRPARSATCALGCRTTRRCSGSRDRFQPWRAADQPGRSGGSARARRVRSHRGGRRTTGRNQATVTASLMAMATTTSSGLSSSPATSIRSPCRARRRTRGTSRS
jgi:hypothetical protein